MFEDDNVEDSDKTYYSTSSPISIFTPTRVQRTNFNIRRTSRELDRQGTDELMSKAFLSGSGSSE